MKSHFNSFVNGLTNFSQNQILLAILGGVTLLSVFGFWHWNQEQHQKFITEQKAKCQSELETAWHIVNRSKTLYKLMLTTESKQLLPLSQPDVNTKF